MACFFYIIISAYTLVNMKDTIMVRTNKHRNAKNFFLHFTENKHVEIFSFYHFNYCDLNNMALSSEKSYLS